MTEKIRAITIEIERELWEKYKSTVPRTITLNDSIVHLIKDKLRETKK